MNLPTEDAPNQSLEEQLQPAAAEETETCCGSCECETGDSEPADKPAPKAPASYKRPQIGGIIGNRLDGNYLGKLAFVQYCEAVGHTSFAGDPLPTWENVPKQIRQAWIDAGTRVARRVIQECATLTSITCEQLRKCL